MKKFFTLALLAAAVLSANGQVRKWNFTNWGAATVANLQKGAGVISPSSNWSDIEKSTGTVADATGGKCFWQVATTGVAVTGAPLTADGQVIAETDGLLFTNTNSRNLAIAVNYPKALSDYHGPQYLWLGGAGYAYFQIPNVKPGSTIEMGVESHKNTDARGVELFVGPLPTSVYYADKKYAAPTTNVKLNDPEGNAVAAPKDYTVQKWLLPSNIDENETAVAKKNEDGTYNISVVNTNGCHLYYITVTPPDGSTVTKKVAYVTSGDADAEFASIMKPTDGYEWTVVSATSGQVNADSLKTFDAVVVSSSVATDAAIVPVLKSVIAYEPMLNLNAALYAAWGYGQAVQTEATSMSVTASGADLFDGIATEGAYAFGAAIKGVTLSGYFANDAVLANAGTAVAVHQHNAKRNSYMFLPLDEASLTNGADSDSWPTLLANALTTVSDTKKDITAAAAPIISGAKHNGYTTVTITASTAGATIYYTTDGTEPTTASTVYSASFNVEQATTVKAIAVADGYTTSSVSSADITISVQAAKPVIAIQKDATSSTVTLSCASEGAKIYYSFGGATTAIKATEYTAPITVTEPSIITAFATGTNLLQSETAQNYVAVNSFNAQTIRIDTVAHFNGNTTDWYTNAVPSDESLVATSSGSVKYYFGKNAWNYYNTDTVLVANASSIVKENFVKVDTIRENEEIVKFVTYALNSSALRTATSSSDANWIIKSKGQVATGETTLAPELAVGNGEAGRFAEAADDMIGGLLPTKGALTFGGKTSGEPTTMSIETREKIQAPFDVVTFLGNGTDGSHGVLALQVSTDGDTWSTVGNLNITDSQRYWKRTRLSYDGTDQVYVRVAQISGAAKAQLYDIFILNNGQYSKAYDAAVIETGIEEVSTAIENSNNEGIYDIAGRRLNNITVPGLYIVNGQKVVVK